MHAFFTILVASWQAGDKLISTLQSVTEQSEQDWRLIVKDAGSTDGSLEQARKHFSDERIRYVVSEDDGIYDGMNQAIDAALEEADPALDAQGAGVMMFLNCGDLLEDRYVLEKVREQIVRAQAENRHGIYYGDFRRGERGPVVKVRPNMDAFACFRSVFCHQACFYDVSLMRRERFCTKYRVRADYEHLLRCRLQLGVDAVYLGLVICRYEGGGYSETPEGEKISSAEHREITGRYFSRGQLFLFRSYLILTLQPLRKRLAAGRLTGTLYHRLRG